MGLPLFCSVSTLQGTFYYPHNVIQTENNLNVIVVLPKIIHPQKYTHFRIKSGVFFQFGFEKVSVYLFYLCMNKQQTKPALCISRLQQSTINQSINRIFMSLIFTTSQKRLMRHNRRKYCMERQDVKLS